jgi:hypothetical protein
MLAFMVMRNRCLVEVGVDKVKVGTGVKMLQGVYELLTTACS